jgi:hypothetical protein
MADLAAKIAKARKAGYSDAEIAAHISKDAALAPKFAQARKAGYSDGEILGHLGKVSPVADIARGAVAGLRQGMASMVDMAAANTPFGQLGRMSPSNPLGMPTLTNPIGTLATRYAARDNYAPQTTAGKYAKATGAMIPNALAPGGLVRRAASVVLPGVAGEGARQAAEGMGGNALAQGAAQLAGNVVGGGVAAARVARQPATAAKPMPRQNANELAARAAEYRAAGINPALVDVVDDAGRGAVRAAASRMTPARQKATDFQDARALDLPSRMGRQARRVMSQDARTPDQIRAEMAQRRSTRADAAFGAVRRDEVQLAPEGVEALRTDYGRAALREAARRERDPDTRAALNRLADAALDAPSTPITVGMADRVSRVLLGQAQEAARRGDNDLATTLGGLGRSIRSPTAQASPGYRQALDDFGADTRLQEAAEVGEDLLSPNTDEFAARAANLSDEERALALAAGRRAIERKAGENVGAGARGGRARPPPPPPHGARAAGPQRRPNGAGAGRAASDGDGSGGAAGPQRQRHCAPLRNAISEQGLRRRADGRRRRARHGARRLARRRHGLAEVARHERRAGRGFGEYGAGPRPDGSGHRAHRPAVRAGWRTTVHTVAQRGPDRGDGRL